ncbi:class I SAM-dependent methyltransferase [Flaviaesturariibacter amylovorans]|uniref:Class I SAM-dependent methyltransferase n=1 Tax=Flaviaesturariibacter amylovorans TaxID=1084520 RepID=A0ABP8HU63_9BACT
MEPDYISVNRASWNRRTAVHLESSFYDQQSFLAGRSSLNEIELPLLGDLRGQRVLHLQCHFGQDTISLARLGAAPTGVDLSDAAIDAARAAADATGADARFLCCDLYDLPAHLDESFDVVFSSYGTIGWLPDLERWAALIARYLKPGGRFVFAEFHPVVWMFDDALETVGYRYFNSGPIVETESGTYAERGADMELSYVCWNHGLAEVITSLLDAGLELRTLREYDYAPYNCLRNMVEEEPGRFRVAHLGNKIPLVYALEAVSKRI